MKPEIWNKSQLESSGSKTCVEAIEPELISIHNMQEAKTNRNGLELKLHGAASGDGNSPLSCSSTQLEQGPRSLCTCLCDVLITLSSKLTSLLQGGQKHYRWQHAAFCKPGRFLATGLGAWKASWCIPGPVAARWCWCMLHPEGWWLHGTTSAVPNPQLIPSREPDEDPAAPGQAWMSLPWLEG